LTTVTYLDTSGWLAVVSERDGRHAAATKAYRTLIENGGRIVTSDLVVAEMHFLTVRHRSTEAGLRLLEELDRDPVHEVRYVDHELARRAIDRWLRPFPDRNLSLADAVGFEIMRSEGISTALAIDPHFQAAGFRVLPAPPEPQADYVIA
jgi:predicted nucleic acid-binding protein